MALFPSQQIKLFLGKRKLMPKKTLLTENVNPFPSDGLNPCTQTFVDATGITDATQINAVDTLVVSLKNANLWDKMIALYPYVGGTAFTHKFNLKDPQDLDSSYRLSFFGGWTHTATGAKPNGANAYADTFLSPDNIGLNSGHMSFYSRTNVTTAGSTDDIGVLENVSGPADSYTDISASKFNIAGYRWGNNVATPTTAPDGGNSLGFYCGTRTAANVIKLFKNGVNLFSASDAAVATTTFSFYISAAHFIDPPSFFDGAIIFSPREQAFTSIGIGLTDSETVALSTIVENYNVSLSRNV